MIRRFLKQSKTFNDLVIGTYRLKYRIKLGIDPLPYDKEVRHHSSPLCFNFHLYFLLSFFQQNFGNRYCFSANLASNLSRDWEPETKEKGLTRVGGLI